MALFLDRLCDSLVLYSFVFVACLRGVALEPHLANTVGVFVAGAGLLIRAVHAVGAVNGSNAVNASIAVAVVNAVRLIRAVKAVNSIIAVSAVARVCVVAAVGYT